MALIAHLKDGVYKRITALATTIAQTPLLRTALGYSVVNCLLRALSLVLVPFTLQILTPYDYGMLNLISTGISCVALVAGLGLRQALSLEYFHTPSAQRGALVHEVLGWYVRASIVLVPVAGIGAFVCTGFSLKLVMIAGLICFTYFFSELFYQVLQYQGRIGLLVVVQASATLLQLTITFLCLWYVNAGLLSILYAQLFAQILVCTVFYSSIKQSPLSHHPSYTRARALFWLKQGAPFIVSMAGAWVISCADRWILAYYAGLYHVGVYSLCSTFVQFFQLAVLNPLGACYVPWFLQKLSASDDPYEHVSVNYSYMSYTLVALLIAGTFALACAHVLIGLLLPAAYRATARYCWVLLIGQLLLAGTYFTNCYAQLYKRTLFLAASFIVPCLGSVLFGFILIAHWGIYGCAVAQLLSYALYFALCLWYLHRTMRCTQTTIIPAQRSMITIAHRLQEQSDNTPPMSEQR